MQTETASSIASAVTVRPRRANALCWAVAVPPLVVLALFAASGVTALVTGTPLVWPAQDVTLTEAIAIHDSGEFVRQIALGANANLRYDTWNVLKEGRHVRVTPLEAAVATREMYLFDLVGAYGASLTADNAPTLHCFALQEHATEIVAELTKRFAPPASCVGIELPW